MVKNSKLVYVIGSIIIGIISVLCIVASLILSGVIDGKSRLLVFSSGSIERTYDGEELTCDTWELKSGELREGHTAHAVITGKQVSVGSSVNAFSIYILDANGADVTADYQIDLKPGTLSVNKRRVELVAASGTHVYDGTAYSLEEYEISAGTIVSGQELSVAYTGEITEVGSCDNVISATVADADGNDVTPNYDLVCTSGELVVEKRPITIKSYNKEAVYSGQPLTTGIYDFTIEDGELVDGHSAQLILSGFQTVVGSSENTFTVKITDADDNDVTKNYDVTNLYGTLTVTKKYIEITSYGGSKVYDGLALDNENWYVSEGSAAVNQTVNVDCFSTITNVGRIDNEFTCYITDAAGDDVTSNYNVTHAYGKLTVTPRPLHIVTGSKSQGYTGDYWSYAEYNIATGYSLVQGQTLNVLSSTQIKNVSKINNQFEVEIKQGETPVTENYNVSYSYGKLQVIPANLIVRTGSIEGVYNGKPYTKPGGSVEGIVANESYEIEAIGERTNVGESKNTYNLSITDKYGESSLSNYRIVDSLGTIVVTPRSLHIETGNGSKKYDGQGLTNTNYTLLNGTSLVDNQAIEIISSTEIYRVDDGRVDNKFSIAIKEGNKAVTDNYKITYSYGKLQIFPVELTVTTGGIEGVYNGRPYTKNVGNVEGVVGTDRYSFAVVGTRTDAGESKNTYNLSITDKYGEGSLSNYTIIENLGIIKVTPIVVIVTTPTKEKEYDGTPLTCSLSEIIISPSVSPVAGEVFTLNNDDVSQTEVGKVNNTVLLTVGNGTKDTTRNYEIVYEEGALIVNPRKIKISSWSTLLMYNGTAQHYPYYDVHEGLLEELGHEIVSESVKFNEKGFTDVNTYRNSFDETKIRFTMNGQDVTKCYEVVPEYGSVTIYPKPIEIRTDDAYKYFDGTPLTCDGYQISGGGLLANHSLVIDVTGTRLSPGESDNTFIVTDIIDDSTGSVVSVYHNYEITEVYGVLHVLATSNGSGGGNGGEGGEGGENGENGGGLSSGGGLSNDGSGEPKRTPVYEVTTSQSGVIYLRDKSFGDYLILPDGTSQWSDGRVYSGGTINPLAFPYLALKGKVASGQTVITKIQSSAPYVIPYYTDLSAELTLNDVCLNYTDSGYNVIDISYLLAHYLKGALTGTIYEAEELKYREFVKGNYMYLPSETSSVMRRVIDENNFSASDPQIIQKVAEFVSNYVPYSFEYHYEGDVASYFFTKATSGICQHYATAATALFRELGFPARYTTGYMGNCEANTPKLITTPGHAWVEVYIDGFGWIPVEVTGSASGGGGGNNQQVVEKGILVKPFDIQVQGDMGTNISYTNPVLQGEALAKLCNENNYTYTFSVSGQQIGLGKSYSRITAFKLYDSEGNDITNEYTFNFRDGVLQVYVQELTVMTGGLTVIYDGKVHSLDINDENAIKYNYGHWGSLMSGHSFGEVEFGNSIRDVGSIANALSKFSIVDANGKDVTDFYKVNYTYGKLTVKARSFVITAGSKTASIDELNGESLTCNEYDIVSSIDGVDALAEGHTIEVVVTGSLSVVGRTTNKITSVVIRDQYNIDVTSNYSYVPKSGKLQVTA